MRDQSGERIATGAELLATIIKDAVWRAAIHDGMEFEEIIVVLGDCIGELAREQRAILVDLKGRGLLPNKEHVVEEPL
jgi:hypothetical protein